jgi:hypothetical protein
MSYIYIYVQRNGSASLVSADTDKQALSELLDTVRYPDDWRLEEKQNEDR